MKAILIFTLLTLTLCEAISGGWEKRSINENSLEINKAFKMAAESYLENKNLEEDDLIRLTVYSQIVSGINYKVTFIDTKAEFPSIQEYVVYFPLPSENLNEEIIEQTEYEATNGLVTFNDPLFSKLENKLYYFLKDTSEKLIYISYIYPIENKETYFYMISSYTEKGEMQYVIGQDKQSGEFYSFNKIY